MNKKERNRVELLYSSSKNNDILHLCKIIFELEKEIRRLRRIKREQLQEIDT